MSSPFPAPRKEDLPYLVILSAFSLLMFLPGLGRFGIMDPSDGLYAEGAREMVESGNYLTPYFNYAPFFEKPILIYWLIAASYKIFGVSEFAARLPSAIAAVTTVCFVYLVSRRFISRRAAAFTCLTLLSNLMYAVIGHLALTDMPLTGLATVAALSLFCQANAAKPGQLGFLILAYTCLALSVLLKGPIILVITALALLLNKLLVNIISPRQKSQSLWAYMQRFRPLMGVAVIAIVSLPWFVAEHSATKGAFTQEFLIRQNFGRIAGAVNHVEPWWFYLPYMFACFLPWTLLAPSAIPLLKRLVQSGRPLTPRRELAVFCLSWALASFGIFTAVRTKLPPYILPAIPLTCVLIGMALDTWSRVTLTSRRSFQVAVWSAAVMGVLAVTAVTALSLNYAKSTALSSAASYGFVSGCIALTLTTARLLFLLAKRDMRFFVATLVLGWFATVVLLVPSALLCFYKNKFADLKETVDAAAGSNLSTFWRDTTAGVFYHRQKVTLVMTTEDLQRFVQTPERPHWIIVTRELIPFLELEAKTMEISQVASKGNFVLIDLDKTLHR